MSPDPDKLTPDWLESAAEAGRGPSIADPFFRVDDAANVETLVRRLESRVELPYYASALGTAFGLVRGSPKRVVELGCGTGATCRRLAEWFGPSCEILGVDLSEKLIEVARQRAAESEGGPSLGYLVADAQATGLPAASFDLVFAATLLEHTASPAAIVAEMARLARPGGEVVVLAQDYETLILNNPEQEATLTRRLLNAFVDGFASPWAGRSIGGWMRAAGLRQVAVVPSAAIETSTSPAFLDYLGQMMQVLTVETGQLKAGDLEAWLAALRRANDSGAFFLNWEFFCWRGER